VTILWTAAAREDLQEIRAWLDERNQAAAGRVIRFGEEIGWNTE
jgi:hypothetical protein